MSDKQTPDRKRASPSAPRRVEKVGEAQLIEDSAGRLISVPIRTGKGSTKLREPRMINLTCLAPDIPWLPSLMTHCRIMSPCSIWRWIREEASGRPTAENPSTRRHDVHSSGPRSGCHPPDTLPDHVTLFDLAVDPPRLWEAQRKILQLDGPFTHPARDGSSPPRPGHALAARHLAGGACLVERAASGAITEGLETVAIGGVPGIDE